MKIKKVIIAVLVVLMLSSIVFTGCFGSSDWAYEGMNKRVKITIPESMISGTLNNFPLFIDEQDIPLSVPDGNYVFSTLDGKKIKSEKCNNGYWVNIPTLSSSSNKINMYFEGNANSPGNPWDAYTGVWHFDETDLQYRDSSPNNIDSLNMVVESRQEPGVIGFGPKFRGRHYINFGHNELFEDYDFHISMWVLSVNTDAEHLVMSWEPRNYSHVRQCNGTGWNLEIGWNHKDILIQNGDYDRNLTSSGDDLLENNTWYHIQVDRNDGGPVKYYVNGEEVSTYTYETNPNYATGFFNNWWRPQPDSTFHIGHNGYGALSTSINMDEVRFSPHIKGEVWAKTSYLNQKGDIDLLYGNIESQ